MNRPVQHPASHSEARKRDQYEIHHDPDVRALIARERRTAEADAWDAAHRVMCDDVVGDQCHLNPGYRHANPYRTEDQS